MKFLVFTLTEIYKLLIFIVLGTKVAVFFFSFLLMLVLTV